VLSPTGTDEPERDKIEYGSPNAIVDDKALDLANQYKSANKMVRLTRFYMLSCCKRS